jgi:hypothetical protein
MTHDGETKKDSDPKVRPEKKTEDYESVEVPLVIKAGQYPIILDSLKDDIAATVKRTVDAYITKDDVLRLTQKAELHAVINNGLRMYLSTVYLVALVRITIIFALSIFLFLKGILHSMPIIYIGVGLFFYLMFEVISLRSVSRLVGVFIEPALRLRRRPRR